VAAVTVASVKTLVTIYIVCTFTASYMSQTSTSHHYIRTLRYALLQGYMRVGYLNIFIMDSCVNVCDPPVYSLRLQNDNRWIDKLPIIKQYIARTAFFFMHG